MKIIEETFPELLSKEEEKELLKKIKEGDRNARNKLVEHNLRLVVKLASKFYSSVMEFEDIIQVGTIGLIKGVDTYQEEKGYTLTTYIYGCIKNEILLTLRNSQKFLNETTQDKDILEKELVSENQEIEKIETIETYIILLKAIRMLPKEERELVVLYFGLYEKKRHTQLELARKSNVSEASISRRIKNALFKIKRNILFLTQYKHQNIYTYFKKNPTLLNLFIWTLKPAQIQVLQKKYGQKLIETKPIENMAPEEIVKLYQVLDKLEKIMAENEKQETKRQFKKENVTWNKH